MAVNHSRLVEFTPHPPTPKVNTSCGGKKRPKKKPFWRTSSPPALCLRISRVFPNGLEQQASISLLHLKAQLSEGGVVGGAAALQAAHQLLVPRVAFQQVPDGKDGPLADNCRRPVKVFNPNTILFNINPPEQHQRRLRNDQRNQPDRSVVNVCSVYG